MKSPQLKDVGTLEQIQVKAAGFVCDYSQSTNSVNSILSKLDWKQLDDLWRDVRLAFLFKVVHGHQEGVGVGVGGWGLGVGGVGGGGGAWYREAGLTTVLSLTRESPFLGKTVVLLRRGPGCDDRRLKSVLGGFPYKSQAPL